MGAAHLGAIWSIRDSRADTLDENCRAHVLHGRIIVNELPVQFQRCQNARVLTMEILLWLEF